MDVLERLRLACPGGGARDAGAGDGIDGVQPRWVAMPGGTAEVAAVVGIASEEGLCVVPRGAGRQLDWGGTPVAADLAVSLENTNRILEHARADLVVRVEAGVTLARLNDELRPSSQWLPVDEVVPGSTIGGVFATGISGPSRYLHGGPRDLVTGLTFVRADGTICRSGSKVVKNVAGYDLGKLLTGSYGTLGIITELTLRLRPLAPCTTFVSASFDDTTSLRPVLGQVVSSQLAPTAVELHRPSSKDPIELCVRLDGHAESVEKRSTALNSMLGPGRATGEPPRGWGALPGATTLKASVPIASVTDLVGEIGSLNAEVGVEAELRGSAGAGVIFAGVSPVNGAGEVGSFLRRVRDFCGACGGAVIVLRGPADTRADLDVWGPVAGIGLMASVKHEFDPEHRLSPGRFVGEI